MLRSTRRLAPLARGPPLLYQEELLKDPKSFAKGLGAACRVAEGGLGCFALRLQEPLRSLHEELEEEAKAFFAMDLSEKMKASEETLRDLKLVTYNMDHAILGDIVCYFIIYSKFLLK